MHSSDCTFISYLRSLLLPCSAALPLHSPKASPSSSERLHASKRKLMECCLQIECRMEISAGLLPFQDPLPQYFRKDLLLFCDAATLLWDALLAADSSSDPSFSAFLAMLTAVYGQSLPRTLRGLYKHLELDLPACLRRKSDEVDGGRPSWAIRVEEKQRRMEKEDLASQSNNALHKNHNIQGGLADDDNVRDLPEPETGEPAVPQQLAPSSLQTDRLTSEHIDPKKLGHFVRSMNTPHTLAFLKTVHVKPRELKRVKRRRTSTSSKNTNPPN